MPMSSSNPRRKAMYSPAMTSVNTTTKPAMTARVARSLSRIARASRLTRRPRSLRTSREVEIEGLEVGNGRVPRGNGRVPRGNGRVLRESVGVARGDGPAQPAEITVHAQPAGQKQA